LNGKATIGLDYSHNNILTLESSSFGEFTQFLFTSGYRIGKIEAGFHSLNELKKYNTIILSTPKNNNLKQSEINNLEKYIKGGGSLLIVSSTGGKPHVLTEQIKKIVFSSSCSTQILDFIEDEKNIKIDWILESGLNCWRKRYDGENWIEEDSPKIPLMVAVEYYKGKVVGFGNFSIFSSLAREYGFSALDNDILIANILSFLIGSLDSEGKPVTVELNMDLYYWAEDIVKQEKWDNVSDLINVSLKYFKDNYGEIIKEIKKIRQERLEKRKAYEKTIKEAVKEAISQDRVLEKVPVMERKKEDLEDIMTALEDITGEKYEISIDLEEEDLVENKNMDSIEYNEEDIIEFEQGFPKKAIWHGKATIAFKEWLEEKYKN
jgi:Arc/MetJ-type ribon-helix-helix transcriptional regulator